MSATAEGSSTQDSAAASKGGARRPLRSGEKAKLGLLALPSFALALAITTVSTYLSEVTRRYTHQTVVIGLIIGGEGVMALWIPLIAGSWSDKMGTRLGGRLPFIIGGAIPAAGALALIGFMHSLGLVALVAALFFAFYFVAYEPYRALYPDLLDQDAVAGRAQSTQALARGLGTGLALLAGGLLLSISRPLPFALAALILLTAIGVFAVTLLRRKPPRRTRGTAEGPLQLVRRLPRLVTENPPLRPYLIANALWETALSALKAFVVLYVTLGLHYKLATASLIIGGVALVILVGAAVAGKAGDKYGRLRVVTIALWAYGAGYTALIFTTSRPLIAAAIPLVALGGGAVMTLAYAILMPLMPEGEHGAITGLYSLSRGVGIITGPILAGVAISLTGNQIFKATQGFQAMWIVCAAATLLSVVFVRRLRRRLD